ncbi:MAG: hypothetical protein JNL97_00860 [Verrucomicrobiales bacterium]|nr:hypothetical protein [Verrucomicrobiales bacterium]
MHRTEVIWTVPEPLWDKAGPETGNDEAEPMGVPSLLRFAGDDFMDQFARILSVDPKRLGEFRVVPETWRGVVKRRDGGAMAAPRPAKAFALPLQRLAAIRRRTRGAASAGDGRKPVPVPGAPAGLKLFQPSHGRYYLVAAALVCRRPGLPDRRVDPAREEEAGFVMRRLLPGSESAGTDPENWVEHAWVEREGVRQWKPVVPGADGKAPLEDGEEVLPLFAANHLQDDGRSRRVLAGLVPVGRREAYLAAPRAADGAGAGAGVGSAGVSRITARKVLLRRDVIEPWKALVGRAAEADARAREVTPGAEAGDPPFHRPSGSQMLRAWNEARSGLSVGSYYVLLDFAKFLERYVPDVWAALTARRESPPRVVTPIGAGADLLRALDELSIGPRLQARLRGLHHSGYRIPSRFADALLDAAAASTLLESTTAPFDPARAPGDWPDFVFPLADPEWPDQAALPSIGALPAQPDAARRAEEEAELPAAGAGSATPEERIDRLAVLVLRAMPATTREPEPEIPLSARRAADPLTAWFRVRCVYTRPRCGPIHDDVVSARTEPFELAGFFDPDAPARPIRIGLPIDTSPAGLRKFDRNTAFVLSNTLCGQVKRIRGMSLGDLVRAVLPWPFHKDLSVPDGGPCASRGVPFGMICSLSLPIITLCALILLIIMVTLLDLVFRWLPFFVLCFPVPKLEAKTPDSSR